MKNLIWKFLSVCVVVFCVLLLSTTLEQFETVRPDATWQTFALARVMPLALLVLWQRSLLQAMWHKRHVVFVFMRQYGSIEFK